jgi:hypothetical protein
VPGEDVSGDGKPKKKTVCNPATLLGNVKKVGNIQALQEHWKYQKKQPTCLGTFCFVDEDGNHIPLSHKKLDCWCRQWYDFCSLSTTLTNLFVAKGGGTRNT